MPKIFHGVLHHSSVEMKVGTWTHGAGVPSSGLGSNGMYYLNSSNGDIYYKSGGAWALIYGV